jgi:Cu/Ag efflux protein CusF
VLGLDPAAGKVELEHEAIPSMQWPPMTMGFVVQDKGQMTALKKGDAVDFETSATPDKDGNYVIRDIRPRGRK